MPVSAVSPIVAVLDHPDVTLTPGNAPTAVLSLVEAFSVVPDPRKARGIRHSVLAILLLGACAVLTGARSFAAIAEYAHDTGRAVLELLGVGAAVPHESTIRRVLQGLGLQLLDARRAYQPAHGVSVQAQRARLPRSMLSPSAAHPRASSPHATARSPAGLCLRTARRRLVTSHGLLRSCTCERCPAASTDVPVSYAYQSRPRNSRSDQRKQGQTRPRSRPPRGHDP